MENKYFLGLYLNFTKLLTAFFSHELKVIIQVTENCVLMSHELCGHANKTVISCDECFRLFSKPLAGMDVTSIITEEPFSKTTNSKLLVHLEVTNYEI